MWSLMPEQNEGDNHMSKINVSPVSHTIFFFTRVPKNEFVCPARVNKIHFMTR